MRVSRRAAPRLELQIVDARHEPPAALLRRLPLAPLPLQLRARCRQLALLRAAAPRPQGSGLGRGPGRGLGRGLGRVQDVAGFRVWQGSLITIYFFHQ